MRIIYLHQYFKTPGEGGAIRSYYIAKAMAERGIDVEMITAHNSPNYQKTTIEGIAVNYLPVNYRNEFGLIKRLYAFAKFAWLSHRIISGMPRADLVYATSTPLTVGLVALKVFRKYKIPYCFEVRDLWPEAPIQMKMLKNPVAIRFARRMEKRIYDHALKIIALSPGIKEKIAGVTSNKNIHIVPNMADCDFFKPGSPVPKPFVISYCGAIGRANHLEYLVHIAEECAGSNLDVQFHIAGNGARLEAIKKLAAEKKCQNIQFIGQLDKPGVRDFLGHCHAVYVSFKNIPVLTSSSPNKFFDALAAGKMTIVNTKGWLKEMTEQYGTGFYADPDDAGGFVQKIIPYLNDHEKVRTCQQNARKLAEDKFSRTMLTAQLCNLLITTEQ